VQLGDGDHHMTNKDIQYAIHFLRRVVVMGVEVDVLIRTVEALEKELERRSHHK
jgi:hypothetical protein